MERTLSSVVPEMIAVVTSTLPVQAEEHEVQMLDWQLRLGPAVISSG